MAIGKKQRIRSDREFRRNEELRNLVQGWWREPPEREGLNKSCFIRNLPTRPRTGPSPRLGAEFGMSELELSPPSEKIAWARHLYTPPSVSATRTNNDNASSFSPWSSRRRAVSQQGEYCWRSEIDNQRRRHLLESATVSIRERAKRIECNLNKITGQGPFFFVHRHTWGLTGTYRPTSAQR
jgi:hypothetical protein